MHAKTSISIFILAVALATTCVATVPPPPNILNEDLMLAPIGTTNSQGFVLLARATNSDGTIRATTFRPPDRDWTVRIAGSLWGLRYNNPNAGPAVTGRLAFRLWPLSTPSAPASHHYHSDHNSRGWQLSGPWAFLPPPGYFLVASAAAFTVGPLTPPR
jgi:hypothetical protein